MLPEKDTEITKKDSLETLKDRYLEALKSEISTSPMRHSPIYTLYFGGGTPYQLGEERLIALLHHIYEHFDLSKLRECTIEINPDPLDRVPQFMKRVEQECPFLKGLRRSIGTQTFDDSLLVASKRAYTFLQLKDFFHQLSLQKSPHVRYNLDLIAFGKLVDGMPRGQEQVDRFGQLLKQKLFDSISLYTLELFPGSDWYHQSHHTSKAVQQVYGNHDMIFDEFTWLRAFIYRYGYKRQELSNFALSGKGSFHNDVYRSMQSYLGLGINASSYMTHEDAMTYFGSIYIGEYGVRFQNTKKWKEYLGENKAKLESKTVILSEVEGNGTKSKDLISGFDSYEPLTREQYLKDSFFLGLRKQSGLTGISRFLEILREDWRSEVEFLEGLGKVIYMPDQDHLQLTDNGFDVYNSVVNSLMK